MREGMNLLARGGVVVCAGVGGGVSAAAFVGVVVVEGADALGLARVGASSGRGRWWMSYACGTVSRSFI